ncbi:putative choriogenin hminor protein [Rosellinia necatrix]|uniref:Putative choriogenin hminor protein n=1 Tax=Rosellinia necatrix TaxID=77044 RepID=A0A1W2TJT3_ROSNE|nr:putative choriogenin hminor protein [Rosellinia necatrix]
MLKGFLYDEVCEINIELGPGARGHFERFRALLRELYAAYFDYYPALANDSRTPVLTVETFRTIRTDFEALYQFLVDETFDVSQIHRHQSESTMHILESIRSFDRRYHCETLIRPLPLVPYTPRRKSPVWKTSWWNRSARTNHLWQADISAIILSGAANWHRRDVAKNQLVSAYRKFEGRQPASLTKADKLDKIGPVDGRKIRWILIYAIYQILRQATEVAAEVRNTAGVPYHLCISTTSLPPWKQVAPSHTTGHSPLYESSLSTSPFSSCSFQTKSDDGGFLFPDQNIRITGQRRGKMSSWKTNFANSVSRKSSKLRRSLSLFRNRETGHHSRAAQRDCREASVYRHGNGVSPTADDKELATGVISGDPVHPLSYMFIGSSASVNSNVLGYGNSPKSVTFAAPDATVSRNMGRSQSLKYECHDAKRRSAPDLRLEMPSPQAPTAWDHIQTVMEGEASNYEFGDQEELDRPTSLRPPIKARPKRTTTAPTYRRASMLY